MEIIPVSAKKPLIDAIVHYLASTPEIRVWIDTKEFLKQYDLPESYDPILTHLLSYVHRQVRGKSSFPFRVMGKRSVENNGRRYYQWELVRTR
jgi:hypothetical protein